MNRHLSHLGRAVVALALAACGDDHEPVKSSGGVSQGGTTTTATTTGTSSTTTGTSSTTATTTGSGLVCCLSGTTYSCPTQEAEKACGTLDPSGCTKVSVSPDGHCPHP